MDEKRIEHIEAMVGELIRIVGNTNAMVEELRDGLKGLNGKVDNLEIKVDVLREDVDLIKRTMVTREVIRPVNNRMDFHTDKMARMEEDVYRLKRLAGIS